jgi:hypothetical protein
MVQTDPRTLHVGLDPSRICSLTTHLTTQESVAFLDGGCDIGLLGDGWYILGYSRRYANIVGFDEFFAKKSGLPIITRITSVPSLIV